MLREYFEHLGKREDRSYLHWNMRNVSYGFSAIEHRFRKLNRSSEGMISIDDHKKFDLAAALKDIYGDEYVDHPRMEELLKLNKKIPRFFLGGEEGAQAFAEGRYFDLHQSTLSIAEVLADVARLARDGKLKTTTSWWDLHGGGIRETVKWFMENPKWGFFGGVIGIAGIIVGVVGWVS